MPERPNIVLCICDQLRAFEVGCYGNAVIRTPNIDRLAREGVRFEQTVTNFPVCMAARSVLLSGQYNRTCTGGVSNVAYQTWAGDCAMPEYPVHGRPHLRDQTLPEALRALGYHTSVIGKWHVHSWPNDVGFDDYLIPRVHHCHSGQSFTRDGGPEFVPEGWSVDFEAAEVERFVAEQARADGPFFLYYSISPPHCPVADAPERYRLMYPPADVPIRPNVDLGRPLPNQDYWFRVYRWDFRHYSLRLPYTDDLPEDYGLRELIAEYYGMTTWMDDAVGRMLTALDDAGLAESTIVVFTSDHGDNLGSLGLVQKGGPNGEAVRIPLVMRYPRQIEPRAVTDSVASLVDIAPTLIELADGRVPPAMHGQSLAPALRGMSLARAHAFIETGNGAGVLTPTHLYFLPMTPDTRSLAETPSRFHDLVRDPYELADLSGTGEQDAAARYCDAVVREWDRATPWLGAS